MLEYWSIDFQRLTKVDLRLFENGRWIISSVVPVMIAPLTLLQTEWDASEIYEKGCWYTDRAKACKKLIDYICERSYVT